MSVFKMGSRRMTTIPIAAKPMIENLTRTLSLVKTQVAAIIVITIPTAKLRTERRTARWRCQSRSIGPNRREFNGVINTNGFTASVLDIPDVEFLSGGPLHFRGKFVQAGSRFLRFRCLVPALREKQVAASEST